MLTQAIQSSPSKPRVDQKSKPKQLSIEETGSTLEHPLSTKELVEFLETTEGVVRGKYKRGTEVSGKGYRFIPERIEGKVTWKPFKLNNPP